MSRDRDEPTSSEERTRSGECQEGEPNVTLLMPYTEPTDSQMVALTVILSLLSVIGTVGNTLVIIVFKSKQEKLVSTFYILVLSVVDLVTCLFIVPFAIFMENVRFRISSDAACKFYQFLITSNIPFSALIMVAIAFDRYFAICHPLSRMGRHAAVVSKASVAVLACFAVSIGLVVSLMYGVRIRVSPEVDAHADPLENSTHLNPRPLLLHLGNFASHDVIVSTEEAEQLAGDGNDAFWPQVSPFNRSSCGHLPRLRYVQQSADKNGSLLVDAGQCTVNFILLTREFILAFQKAYIGLFVVCFFVVAILYVVLFLSVCKRRRMRGKKKKNLQTIVGNMSRGPVEGERMSRSPGVQNACRKDQPEEDEVDLKVLEVQDGEQRQEQRQDRQEQKNLQVVVDEKHRRQQLTPTHDAKQQQQQLHKKKRKKSLMKDAGQVMANLKTALMLFVVTVVFIVTYLPAFLSSLNYLDYNVLVHYMYFANNVANPFIYSFMNEKFRNGLVLFFCGRKR